MSFLLLFKLFFRVGLLGFGGPVALIALIESEVCRRRQWMHPREFSERFVICKLLPGPVAFQMALWVGHHMRGFLGGLVAGLGFLLPGATLILLFGVFYDSIRGGSLGLNLIAGVRIGVLVVIWDSAVKLFEAYYRQVDSWCFLIVGFCLMMWAPSMEPAYILLGGAGSLALRHPFKLQQSPWILATLFWVHFKAGAFTFGTGLAILPVLQHQVVDVFHWMSHSEFLDAVAIGTMTPGPVTLTSTFIGFRAAGILGALAATLGMYLPGCLIILGLMPKLFPILTRSKNLYLFCDGAIPVVIGCIIAASFSLVGPALTGTREMVLCFALLILNIGLKLVGWKILIVSGISYYVMSLF